MPFAVLMQDPLAGTLMLLALLWLSAKVGGELALRLKLPSVTGELAMGLVLTALHRAWPLLPDAAASPATELLGGLGVVVLIVLDCLIVFGAYGIFLNKVLKSYEPAATVAQAEPGNYVLVARGLGVLEVVEELAALRDELEQPAARGVVTLVRGEMLAEFVDAGGEQRNLHFRGSRVVRGALVSADNLGLSLGGQCHR